MDQEIKKIIFDTVLSRVIVKLIKAVPLFSLPIINPIVVWAVTKVATLIYDELSLHVSFMILDIQTKEQAKEYQEKLVEFKQAIESGVEDEIAAKKNEVKDSLRKLISLR